MKHYTEDEWVEFHFGESYAQSAMFTHVADCPACKALLLGLEADLAEITLEDASPVLASDYGERMWESIEARLPKQPEVPKQKAGWSLMSPRQGLGTAWWLALAGAAAVLAIAAFFTGRLWEHRQVHSTLAESPAHTDAQTRQRIILFVVIDHLDRSQRLLAELDDSDAAANDKNLQSKARELLSENRLYRMNAAESDANPINARSTPQAKKTSADDQDADASLRRILDDLEPVLVEIAHEPDSLKPAQIAQLRKDLNTGDLLFEIRVLRTEVRGDESSGGSQGQKSLTQVRKGLI